MKIILISDIAGQSGSIIPYGLNFAKHLNDRAQVMHVVDPRKYHAVSSAYADSQTIEVADKMTHAEILQREIKKAKSVIDYILSSEASRLNFPLRVASNVSENTLERKLKDEIDQNNRPFIIASSEADGAVIDDLNEFFEITSSFLNWSLLVPPGIKYSKPKKALLLHDFDIENNEDMLSIFSLLQPFGLSFDVVQMAGKADYAELEMRRDAWVRVAQNHNRSYVPDITARIIESAPSWQYLLKYIQRHDIDLLILPRNNPGTTGPNLILKSIPKQVIEQHKLPVLLY